MADLDKLFYVNVGKEGTFHPSGNQLHDTTAADVDKIFEKLKQDNQKRLLLYFHGGLVNNANGMITAERITRYTTTGATSHPVCFVWETGLTETLLQNFDTIGKSTFFKKLLVKIIKVAGKELGIDLDNALAGSKGIGSMSDTEIRLQLERDAPFEETFENEGKRSPALNANPAQIESDIYYDNVITPEVKAAMKEEIDGDPELIALAVAEKPPQEAALMKNEITEDQANGEKGILSAAKLILAAVKIAVAVIKRYMRKRDHGFYPTVIEEIFREIYIADLGTWVWGRMKVKAKDMWEADDFSGSPENWHAGTYFLKKLAAYQQDVGKLTIDLVGHSAGSIVICELIDVVAKRNIDLTFRNIIFMAPACRSELFACTVMKQRQLYEKLGIFTMLDEYEKKDHLVPILYPRSLLYFVSGILEENSFDAYILGMQRYLLNKAPYDGEAVLRNISVFLKDNCQMVYAVTEDGALEGMRSGSMRHGDFDNDNESTLDSIIYLIKG